MTPCELAKLYYPRLWPLERLDKLLELGRSQLGVKEAPAGSNNVMYNTVYYCREVSGPAYPWCCRLRLDFEEIK